MRRQYSDNDKAAALAALDANGGNVKRTAREMSLAVSTLKRWRDGQVNDDVTALRPQKRAELAAVIREELYAILELLPEKRDDATYSQLATAAGIFTDKLRLLNGEDTSKVGVDIVIRRITQKDAD